MSTTTPSQSDEPSIEVRIEPGIEGGVYANAVTMMFSAHEFTLDFSVSLPGETRVTDDGVSEVISPFRVTSRVRIAPTVLFTLMRVIEANMTEYERRFGEIRRFDAEVPLYPPDEYPQEEGPPQGDGE